MSDLSWVRRAVRGPVIGQRELFAPPHVAEVEAASPDHDFDGPAGVCTRCGLELLDGLFLEPPPTCDEWLDGVWLRVRRTPAPLERLTGASANEHVNANDNANDNASDKNNTNETEKRTDMSNHAALIQRLRGAKPVDERDPFIGAGKHKLALAEYFLFESKKHGEAIGARFVVLESTNPNHPPGSVCFQGWYINRAPFFVGDTGEVDRAADFVAKLQGVSLAETGAEFEKLLGGAATQPARGMIIDCAGNPGQGKAKADGTPGKQFVDKVWTTVPQDPQSVSQLRQWLDREHPMQARHAPPAAAQPQYAQQPPPGYGAPAPQGYPGHGGSAMGAYVGPQQPPAYGQPAPQGYPQAPAPQYAQQPPPGYGGAPAAPPPPQYAQPPMQQAPAQAPYYPPAPGPAPAGLPAQGGWLPPGVGR